MAQTLQTSPDSSSSPGKFVYRPILTSAPVAVVLGVVAFVGPIMLFSLGISSAAITFWTLICLLAGILGLFSFRKIRRAPDAFAGAKLATTAIGLAGTAALINVAVVIMLLVNEVPEGYKVINFTTGISQKEIGQQQSLHPDIQSLNGKKIFLKGYMYRGKQRVGLTNFVLVKDNQQCCFGRQPNQSDMVEVYLEPGESVDLELGLTGVAGIFRAANPSPRTNLQFKPIYRIDAEICRPAKVNF
ncbi:MAG: hypothetical protein QF363_12845 [Planctomycetaceae bacterium]|jgi:hypothetical protein|nr:hypothetical protein [Planctomycetaceae bacterium]